MHTALTMATTGSLHQDHEVPGTAVNAPQKRIEWMDTARGIGIILVVYGHVLVGLHEGGFFATESSWWLSDYPIYTFHMPFFFFLAGLNVKGSIEKGKQAFLLGKLWTVAYPYFLWSAVQGTIQLEVFRLAPSSVNHAPSPLQIEGMLRYPGSQFWFLYSLFICHIVALVASRSKWTLVLLGAGCVVIGLISSGNSTSYSLPFYILGIMLSRYITRWLPGLKSGLIAGVSCIFLFAVAVHFGRAASHGNAASIFSLPAALLGIALLCLLGQVIACANERVTTILKAIGVMSMTIYILHIMADTVARFVLKRLGIGSITDQLLVGVIAGVGLPMLAHVTLARLRLLTVLGLAPCKRPARPDVEHRIKRIVWAVNLF
jgi:fucose 4-O-acetylase-like acetyltransferase